MSECMFAYVVSSFVFGVKAGGKHLGEGFFRTLPQVTSIVLAAGPADKILLDCVSRKVCILINPATLLDAIPQVFSILLMPVDAVEEYAIDKHTRIEGYFLVVISCLHVILTLDALPFFFGVVDQGAIVFNLILLPLNSWLSCNFFL